MRDSEKIAALESRGARIRDLLHEATKAAVAAMSPVDRAIMYVQQRSSFVRGNIGMDTEWTPAHQKALDDDPAVVLMNEVLRLRSVLEKIDRADWGM